MKLVKKIDIRMRLSAFLDDGVRQGRLSQEAYEKISRKNAERLLQR